MERPEDTPPSDDEVDARDDDDDEDFEDWLRAAARMPDVARRDPAAAAALEPGARIAERYVLRARLGAGTFGEVWVALDERAGGDVAVKVLHAELAAHAEAAARFDLEARALDAIAHPNVVRMCDRGAGPDARPFLVMEYLDGGTLSDWIARHRAGGVLPPVSEACALFEQVAAGVAAAHAARAPGAIVHRDLKPANVLLRCAVDGRLVAKVADFGLAHLGARLLTRSGERLGSEQYMAPEQAMGRASSVGPWTDVFSLGVLLLELLTGRPAIARGSVAPPWRAARATSRQALRAQLCALRPDVPAHVWEAVARALEPEPAARWPDAGALRAAVARASGDAPSVRGGTSRDRHARTVAWVVAYASAALLGAVVYRQRAAPRPPSSAARANRGTTAAAAGAAVSRGSTCPADAVWVPPLRAADEGFCIARTEVTREAYARCVAAGACAPPGGEARDETLTSAVAAALGPLCRAARDAAALPRHPVACVDFVAAFAYCAWRGGRLPTEHEWVRAAGAGDARAYPWGTPPPDATRANVCGGECRAALALRGLVVRPLHEDDDGWAETAPVGSFAHDRTADGALDLGGNVAEWTARPGDTASAVAALPATATRAVRGGHWISTRTVDLRVAARVERPAASRSPAIGLRCAFSRAPAR